MVATVTVVGDFAVYDGHASTNLYLVRGLHRAGAQVSVVPLSVDTTGCPTEFLELLGRSRSRMDGPVLCSSWMLRKELACYRGAELFVRTVCEGSAIPPTWPANLNHVRGLIVPSSHVAHVFRSGGVTAPIAVVPDGVDPDVYHFEPRPRRAGLTTLMVGDLQPRKHYREGVAAWQEVFRNDPEARLIIKCRPASAEGFSTDDPRIHISGGNDTTDGVVHWYRQADVLLALGNEGFGLPLIEAMATGMPVIALDSEGQADVCHDADDLVLSVKPATWEPNPTTDDRMICGVRGVPSVADVAARLRWVSMHRDEAIELGRAASAWVHRNRNVWDCGPDVLAVMEEHTRCRRVLRRKVSASPHPNVSQPLPLTERRKPPAPKYFHESGTGHYDTRFFHGEIDVDQRHRILRRLLEAFLTMTFAQDVKPILMHGGLIGWHWNRKLLPWDDDVDLCLLLSDLEQLSTTNLAAAYDQDAYLFDINPHFRTRRSLNRHHDQSNEPNRIDARFIDRATGLYIDLNALSEFLASWLRTKCPHYYEKAWILPLRLDTIEGLDVYVPSSPCAVLVQEYGEDVLDNPVHNGYRFNPLSREWESFRA